MNKIIFLLLCFFSFSGHSDCLAGKIKYIYERKEIIEKSNYCFNDKFISTKCNKNKCVNIHRFPTLIEIKNFLAPVGSPGFKLCKKLQGSPQIIEYWTGKKWIPTSRCIFSKDEYVEIGYLMRKWKIFIEY